MHMTRVLVGVLAFGLLMAAPATASARSGEPEPFTVDGKPVEGQLFSVEGAPQLGPGKYVDTVPEDGGRKYYIIPRTHRGSTLHIGVTARPKAPSHEQELLVARLYLDDGTQCGYSQSFDNDHQVDNRNSVTTTTVYNQGADREIRERCAESDFLILELYANASLPQFDRQPIGLTVSEEPALLDDKDLPPLQEPALEPDEWATMPDRGQLRTVPGGTSFESAEELRSGAYRSTIRPGEIRFFQVPVEWGQHLQAQLWARTPEGELGSAIDDSKQTMTLRLVGPTRGLAGSDHSPGVDGDVLSSDRALELTKTTLPVRYRNRDGARAEQRASGMPGAYVVMVTLAGDKDGDRYDLPYELSVQVAGEPKPPPPYVSGQRSYGPGADWAKVGIGAVPRNDDGDGYGMPLAFGAAGLAFVALGIFVLTLLRRQSTVDDPGPENSPAEA